jgi:uncharacterized membrane protein YqjE
MQDQDADRSIASVLSDIVGNVQQIVRAEVRLARAEVREEAAKAKRGLMLLGAGAVGFMFAGGFLLLALVYALATVWPAWAAALVVAFGAAAVGGMIVTAGVSNLKSISLAPPRTVSTIQENIEWAKTRAR